MSQLLRAPRTLQPLTTISFSRALHLDPSPASKPALKSDATKSKDAAKEGYGKGGTTSEAYGNEDVEGAIRAAKGEHQEQQPQKQSWEAKKGGVGGQ